jgi:hypothetical protein
MNRQTLVAIGLGLLSLLLASPAIAQDAAEDSPKPDKLFERDDTLDVTLNAPWRDVIRSKGKDKTFPATIEYTDELGNNVTLDLTVETRGITRQRVCKFPPIKLRFDKEKAKGTTFRGQKSIKMVTHCKTSGSYDDYYVLEMLAYQIYNLITDYSFRIRPLNVTYYDNEREDREDPEFAFLIEDDSDVADRHDLEKLVIPQIGYNYLESGVTSNFVLFQYLIGNVDWGALRGPDPEECCHNVKLIAPEPFEQGMMAYPIPYDFDSAGLVNAEYAAPAEGLGIDEVTERVYRGYCYHNDTLPAARQRFLDQQAAIVALVEQEPRLSSNGRRDTLRYLGEAFEVFRDDRKFNDEITAKCRGKHKSG